MGARKIGKVVMLGMVGLTLLVAGQAAPARAAGLAPGKAVVVVYNAGSHTAIDADLVITGHRQPLVRSLKSTDGELEQLPAGMVWVEVRLAGAGRSRMGWTLLRLRAGKAYCLYVGGAEPTQLKDATKQLRVDPSPIKVCRDLAPGR